MDCTFVGLTTITQAAYTIIARYLYRPCVQLMDSSWVYEGVAFVGSLPGSAVSASLSGRAARPATAADASEICI